MTVKMPPGSEWGRNYVDPKSRALKVDRGKLTREELEAERARDAEDRRGLRVDLWDGASRKMPVREE